MEGPSLMRWPGDGDHAVLGHGPVDLDGTAFGGDRSAVEAPQRRLGGRRAGWWAPCVAG